MCSEHRVLVFAPHMDDEVLGCGGTIVRHVNCGDEVSVCIVTDRAYNHEYIPELIERERKACTAAKQVLGYNSLFFLGFPDEKLDQGQIDIIISLENVLKEIKPNIVYLPSGFDPNQDHRAVNKAVRVACRPYVEFKVDELRIYETPSSTDQPWSEVGCFQPNMYVEIESVLDRKLEAMKCYEAESRDFPHPRSELALKLYSQKRGTEIGYRAAECFEVVRTCWPEE